VPWTGRFFGPSEAIGENFSSSWVPYSTTTDNAIRRVQASCMTAYTSDDPSPFAAGSGNSGIYLRVLIVEEGLDPPSGWPTEPDSGDDVLFEPVPWTTSFYLPANVDFGRVERVSYTGSLDPGLAISHGQRRFDAPTAPRVHWYVGPIAAEVEGPLFDLFTTQVGIRLFYETGLPPR